jgi:tRNA(Ile)-lysidine synthase
MCSKRDTHDSCSTESLRKPDSVFSPSALAALLFDEWRLPSRARLRVAYSGGLDSHVLLHALATLRESIAIELSAVHIDHGLQAASASWSEHCARICRELEIPCATSRVTVTGIDAEGTEAAARRARYAAFARMLEPGDHLVTAQQRDDQAETVLLQLLRGAGLAGLAAMPARSRLGCAELLRPLLCFDRRALHEYALRHELHWVEDPSNTNLNLRRNFLRHAVLPRIADQWPEAATNLARSACHAAEAQGLLDELANADLAGCHSADAAYPDGLSVAAVGRLSAPRQRNVLRYWLKKQNYRAPSEIQLKSLTDQLRTTTRSGSACISWPGVTIWRYRNLLVAMSAEPPADDRLDLTWDLSSVLDIPGIGQLLVRPARGRGIAVGRLADGLRVRLRQGGERCLLPGRNHHHSLKKLLQAAGVPPWERARLPLFYAGNDLVAVADRWTCAPYAAGPGEAGLAISWQPFPNAPIPTQYQEKSR